MIRIKLKMSRQEMQVMAKSVLAAGRAIEIAGIDSLLAANTLEGLFIRMYQAFAPGRDAFTFRLSLTEAAVLNRFVLPAMQEGDPLEFAVAVGIKDFIDRKIDTEVSMYNSMKAE